jgi:hypothetical protein
MPKEGIAQLCKTSVEVINNLICFSIGKTNLLSTSKSRKPFSKSISEIMTLSNVFSKPLPGNS